MPRRRKNFNAPVDEKLIGKRLKEIRRRQGVTQVELAEKLGINQSLLSQYERAAIRLHGTLVAAFAKALNVSADEILGLKEPKQNGLIKDRRFLRRFQEIDHLPRRDKQVLLRTIDGILKTAHTNPSRRSA